MTETDLDSIRFNKNYHIRVQYDDDNNNLLIRDKKFANFCQELNTNLPKNRGRISSYFTSEIYRFGYGN